MNMPMLYGEGNRAFLRLQEEIVRTSHDESIFAWGFVTQSSSSHIESWRTLFAASPADFEGCDDIFTKVPVDQPASASHYTLTNRGLLIELRMIPIPGSEGTFLGILNCSTGYDNIAILLQKRRGLSTSYYRPGENPPQKLPLHLLRLGLQLKQSVYIETAPSPPSSIDPGLEVRCLVNGELADFGIGELYPPELRGIFRSGKTQAVPGYLLEDKPHTIICLCDVENWARFLITLKYTFGRVNYIYSAETYFQNLQYSATFIRKGTLAEHLITHNDIMLRNDKELDWKPKLSYEGWDLSFSLHDAQYLYNEDQKILRLDVNLTSSGEAGNVSMPGVQRSASTS